MDQRITDNPPEPAPWGDVPPWELPGACRLDALPHRGEWLQGLGGWALTLGLLSSCPILGIFPGAVALLLGLGVWWVATVDLARMRHGEMDPNGRALTRESRVAAGWAMCWGIGMTAYWLLALSKWLG
jgi:hypothetical protein